MRHTKARQRRIRRKIFQRMMKKCAVYAFGILLLAGAWKLTSFALHSFTAKEQADGQKSETETEYFPDAEEEITSGTEDRDILLVNKDHPLDDAYRPKLIKMRDYGVEVDESVFEALNDMLRAGKKEGLDFWVASGYRSPERQRELLDEDIEELVMSGYSYSEAYEEVVRETMPVGCSEHATGLAVDIVSKNYQILDRKQESTDEIQWLQKNCSRYGFILRYPDGKEDITGVAYESWHFRYVGVDAAREITEQKVTLEEYLGG